MRFQITMIPPDDVAVVPWNYQHYLQGALYRLLIEEQPELDELLHKDGLKARARRYRMLTFSKLFPSAAKATPRGLLLYPPVHWLVSTALTSVATVLDRALLGRAEIRVGTQPFFVHYVDRLPLPLFGPGPLLFETLSPIVVSRPVLNDRKRLTKEYLAPDNPEFWQRAAENLYQKAKAFGLDDVGKVRFQPVGEWRSRLVAVQGAQVRGYEGRFIAMGDPELIYLGYDAGLGERNAQGFGMFGVPYDRTPPKPVHREYLRRRRTKFRAPANDGDLC